MSLYFAEYFINIINVSFTEETEMVSCDDSDI